MKKVKYLLSNVNLMNAFLAGVLVVLVHYVTGASFKMNAGYTLPPVKKPVLEQATPSKTAGEASISPSDYTVIADQNLFHPERTIPVIKVEAPPPPLPKPEFVLYGTLVTDKLQIAYITDKKDQAAQNKTRKQTALKLGDSMSGFVLKAINKDHVLMQRGDEKILLSLNEVKVREVQAPAAPPPAAAAAASPAKAAASRPAQRERGAARQAVEQRREKAREDARRDPGRMIFGRGGGAARRLRTVGSDPEQ